MTTYTCTLDASGWELYSSYEGVEHVAANLTCALNGIIAEAKARLKAESLLSEHKLAEQVRDEMHKHMERVSDLGAMDTEPQSVLVSELEEAFGLDQYSLERW